MLINIQRPKKVSRFSSPQWLTRSALDRYFRASASSTKPKTILTVFIQLPERGRDRSQLGNNANKAKGKPSASPKPAMATLSCTAPPFWFKAPTNRVPRMGPVHENETVARVSAMKKMPLTRARERNSSQGKRHEKDAAYRPDTRF